MMPSLQAVSAAILGTWRMFLNKADAPQYFDLTIRGFWHSFFAAIICLPLVGYISLGAPPIDLGLPQDPEPPGPPPPIAVMALQYALSWIIYPVAMALLSWALRIGKGYIAYIVVYNWSNFITYTCAAILIGLAGIAAIGPGFKAMVGLAMFFFLFRFQYMIARRMLSVPAWDAVGVVLFQFAINVIFTLVVSRLSSL